MPRGDRSKAVIEPWLTDQWFVKIAPLAAPAVKAVEDGDVVFVPKQYENMYFAWMRDIQDWCISRQQWWGHRIPAWYDDAGNVYVGRDEAEARAKAGLADHVSLRQDGDVLDTWFSSALWTFGTLGWPERTPELKDFHPTDVLVTGYDIIFFWVARMIMMTLRFTDDVPFRKVYIHGMVRDAAGAKMSKTSGNGLDPLDIVDGISTEDLVAKRTANMTQPQMAAGIAARTRREYPDGIQPYGTDALRFTFCALASQGRDLAFDMKRIKGYRNFCNKLWNASKFVLMHVDGADLDGPVALSVTDRWIRSLARQLAVDAHAAIATCRFDLYANAVYEFAWHEYCDWYVEFAKPVLFDKEAPPAQVRAVRKTLLETLETLLRIAHPIVPFITEALWRQVAPCMGGMGSSGDTIMREPFPSADDLPADPAAEAAVTWLKGVTTAIRNIRGEMNVSPAKEVELLLQGGDATDQQRLAATEALLKRLAKVGTLRWLADAEEPPPASKQIVGELNVMVPLIDVAAEDRLRKKKDKKDKDLAHSKAKLDNPNFVNKAPPSVVAKERDRYEALRREQIVLAEQLEMVMRMKQEVYVTPRDDSNPSEAS